MGREFVGVRWADRVQIDSEAFERLVNGQGCAIRIQLVASSCTARCAGDDRFH